MVSVRPSVCLFSFSTLMRLPCTSDATSVGLRCDASVRGPIFVSFTLPSQYTEQDLRNGTVSVLLSVRLYVSLASTPPGMPGTHPPIFWLGDVNGNIPQYYYVLSDIAGQYWLPSVRSTASRFHSAIRRHLPSHSPPHSVVRTPTLNSR